MLVVSYANKARCVGPTFDGTLRTVEAYVLDRTDLELYGELVEISFVARIRGMVAFEGVDALVETKPAAGVIATTTGGKYYKVKGPLNLPRSPQGRVPIFSFNANDGSAIKTIVGTTAQRDIFGLAYSASVAGFIAVRFVLGLGESGNFPASIKTVAEWFPVRERAFATAMNGRPGPVVLVAPVEAEASLP